MNISAGCSIAFAGCVIFEAAQIVHTLNVLIFENIGDFEAVLSQVNDIRKLMAYSVVGITGSLLYLLSIVSLTI